uniref:Uncharacterized protein n=1 Tax=Wuchereria bancrofti TaxID=6293 RepID=A0A1I8EU01_WUCBA
LQESEYCKKTYLGDYHNRNHCTAIGGFSDYNCPSQNWLICWPILFALFSKTAKAVDNEADKIWKYQLYSLVEDLRFRPSLPPPLTPIFFLGATYCRAYGCFVNSCHTSNMINLDHPDIVVHNQQTSKFQTTVNQFTNTNDTWNNLFETIPYDQMANIQKLIIAENYRSYHILITNYCPPFYCKSVNDFSNDLQKYNLVLLKKYWKRWQQNKMLELFQFSLPFTVDASGLPRNPNGRQGIAGRGNHLKFGPNLLNVYVLIRKIDNNHLMVLSNQNLLNVGEIKNGVAHVKRVPVADVRDTDNAWMEHDVWAIFLGSQIPERLATSETLNWWCYSENVKGQCIC